MRTRTQIITTLLLVIVAITLRSTVGFTKLVDILVLGFFVILGTYFTYQNFKKEHTDDSQKKNKFV